MEIKSSYPYYIERPLENRRAEGFLAAFEEVLENSNYRSILDLYSRVSMHCSRCATECQIYQATGKPEDVPCYRSAILLRIYKRHFTPLGKLKRRLFGTVSVTESEIDEMLEAFYHCTACGRCTLYCPMGIDHRLLTRLGRFILSKIGIVPKALAVSVREQLEGATGNTSAIPLKALKSTIEFLEEEILEIKGVEVRFPLDVEGAEYVFFPPVSDFLIEADTLMGIACVLNEAGVSWTIASGNYDAINYGLFYSDEVLEKVLQKMADEVIRIKGKKILIGECGHASRSAKAFLPSFNRYEEIPVVNILELTARLIDEGRVQIDTTAVTEKVTYHDPCNIARSGWVVDQPRNIIRSFIKDFVEMTPSGRYNLCCGGGGGTVSINELKPYRMDPAGRKKAEQLKATGADVVITPCANCKKQISELIAHYKLPMRHAGLHDLIFTAIKMKNQVKTDE
ncbi:MAG TPA: (Fe-S)-binding protein [Spirochaetota bacterium]|jgi:Fe-S oxidoreductase|nr:(Fe-S)-binding protein [Spirochaetota bacterium]